MYCNDDRPMASVYKHSSGTYYAQFYDPDREPKRKQVSLRTKRKRAAEKRFRRAEDAWADGRFDPWRDSITTFRKRGAETLTVSDLLGRYVKQKRREDRSHHTISKYEKIVSRAARIAGDPPIENAGPEDFREYVHDDSVAGATQETRYTHLAAVFNYAVEENLLRESPLEALEKPSADTKLPRAVRPTHVDAIAAEIRSDRREKIEGNTHGAGIGEYDLVWMIPAFRFLLYTGLRGAELGRLRWNDVDRERGHVRVSDRKTGREETVPLVEKAEQALESADTVPGEGRDYVFRARPSAPTERDADSFRSNLSWKFTKYRKRAGLPDYLTLHGLRHGFATMLAEAGKSAHTIKRACRHRDIDTSLKYVHMTPGRVADEMEDAFT